MYRGLAIPSMLTATAEEEVNAAVDLLSKPDLRSWRQITNPLGSYVWTVKPPGEWFTLIRFNEFLVTSDMRVPLEGVEWDKVFDKLGRHRAAMLCRLSGADVIGIAVAGPDSPWLPLMPGFKTSTAVGESEARALVNMTSDQIAAVMTPDYLTELSSDRSYWPEGLLEPCIIHIQSAHSLIVSKHRKSWLDKYPEGLWLETVQDGKFVIFEVLS